MRDVDDEFMIEFLLMRIFLSMQVKVSFSLHVELIKVQQQVPGDFMEVHELFLWSYANLGAKKAVYQQAGNVAEQAGVTSQVQSMTSSISNPVGNHTSVQPDAACHVLGELDSTLYE
jgi:hypothetical protein